MPALAELNELTMSQAKLKEMRQANPGFYTQLMMLFLTANRMQIKNGYVCKAIMDVEVEDRYLPALQQNKRSIDQEIWRIRLSFSMEFAHFRSFLEHHKMVGYNNIVSMLLGETPHELKGYRSEFN